MNINVTGRVKEFRIETFGGIIMIVEAEDVIQALKNATWHGAMMRGGVKKIVATKIFIDEEEDEELQIAIAGLVEEEEEERTGSATIHPIRNDDQ